MQLDMNGIIYALSYSLDCIEKELVGVALDHAKWVALLSTMIGKEYGLSFEALSDLAACAALHDNALTQYLASERNDSVNPDIIKEHCRLGEENIINFPFYGDVSGFLLYHHENADGSGPFKKMASEIPIEPQIIHLADQLDVVCHFHDISQETYQEIGQYLALQKDKSYSAKLIDSFFKALPIEKYLSLKNKDILSLLHDSLPHRIREYSFEEVRIVMNAFGRIVDYKSVFTRNHSAGVALKTYALANYYGYPKEKAERLYIAGALHDIGKMAIDNSILEKPDRLTTNEFDFMKKHAYYTYQILSKIDGFMDIAKPASNHHEKLNGSGYPNGLSFKDLDQNDRILACVDTYQALLEDRPYKKGMDHYRSIGIMQDMVKQGHLDKKITEDINHLFAPKTV